MNNDSPTSETQEETAQPAKIYTTLEKAMADVNNHQLYDVCRVVGDGFQFYILVDDLDGNKFWMKFDGVHRDEAINVNKTFKAGQQQYRDRPLTMEDVESMRNIMTAVATLAVLFEYDEQAITDITFSAIVKFAFDLYRKDNKKPDLKLSDMPQDDPELAAYVTKVTFAFEEYRQLVDKVQASVDEATKEATNLPEDDDGTAIVN